MGVGAGVGDGVGGTGSTGTPSSFRRSGDAVLLLRTLDTNVRKFSYLVLNNEQDILVDQDKCVNHQ